MTQKGQENGKLDMIQF